jgi:alpha-tubulin suppressor-like RCC1 family protein
LEVVPVAVLDVGTQYTVYIRPTIKTASGQNLPRDVVVSFTTALTAEAPLTFKAIDTGAHTCALTTEGKAYCWGRNTWGNVGDGTTIDRTTPVPVAGGHTFATISTAYANTCAVTVQGVGYCWGSNGVGQLGDGTRTNRTVPTPVATSQTFTSISTNNGATCGLTPSGDAYCWGANKSGMVGAGAVSCGSEGCTAPLKVSGNLTFASVSVGAYTTCGRTTSGRTYCWGGNVFGELGIGTATGPEVCPDPYVVSTLVPPGGSACSMVPLELTGGIALRAVYAGGFFTCGLDDDGQAYCWGANNTGEFGNGTKSSFSPNSVPTAAAPGYRFSLLDTGNQRLCGVTLTGEAYCWGLALYGAGCGETSCAGSTTPSLVPGGNAFTSITGGKGGHRCGLTGSGQAYCWGGNTYGALGNGSTVNNPVPVAVRR